MTDNRIFWAAALTIGVIVVALVVAWAVRSMGSAARRRIGEYREAYEPLFADLWSSEMHRRLSALFVAQRIARSSSAAVGLGDVLIAFIRHRLSASGRSADGGAGFDDVTLALAILGSKPLRAGRAPSGRGTDLSGLNFRGAPLVGANLRGFRLVRCNFSGCQLLNANFAGSDLAGASFAGADLRRSDLSRADLSDANLSGADLTGARIKGAKLQSANIAAAILVNTVGLEQQQLDEAFGDAGTAVPEQFRFIPIRSQRARGQPELSGIE
jgi:uncharacterized protein YjbI with pentapeptide repeats